MTAFWSPRATVIAACACLALLSGCGSSTTESALNPTRIIAFGDSFADVGQAAGRKYTVNDGSTNSWVQKMAADYGLTIAPSVSGGLGYAQGMARVSATPDAAGNAATLSLTQQIDQFLASGRIGDNDLTVINAGLSDVVAEMNTVLSGAQTEAQMLTRVRQAGTDMANQVKRVVAAGGKHVVIVGTYNLGKTPWAKSLGKADLLTNASTQFNEALLTPLVAMGEQVLYIDSAYYMNLLSDSVSAPGYSISNVNDPVCTSVDAGAGIGTGAGQVNALLCTSATLVAGANIDQYAFADRLHFTPVAHRLFGDYAYAKLRSRW